MHVVRGDHKRAEAESLAFNGHAIRVVDMQINPKQTRMFAGRAIVPVSSRYSCLVDY